MKAFGGSLQAKGRWSLLCIVKSNPIIVKHHLHVCQGVRGEPRLQQDHLRQHHHAQGSPGWGAEICLRTSSIQWNSSGKILFLNNDKDPDWSINFVSPFAGDTPGHLRPVRGSLVGHPRQEVPPDLLRPRIRHQQPHLHREHLLVRASNKPSWNLTLIY